MFQRGLVRTAIAAGAVLAGAVIAASPAAATQTTAPDFGVAKLALPQGPLKAGDFSTKGCDGVPGGAKVDTDGWVFSQPVQGATEYGYILGFKNNDKQVVALGINKNGVTGLEIDQSELQKLNGELGSSEADSLGKAAAGDGTAGYGTDGDGSDRVIKEVPAPKGVAGGLTSTGEAWLQTPAGWQLVVGGLVYTPAVEHAPEKFSLLRVCAPKTEPTTAPAVAPTAVPGAGGGGASLPVTGANVAVLSGVGAVLVGIGALLFVVRRRREDTKFVA